MKINYCVECRSLDLDKCPQRISCEFGSFVLPVNSTQLPTAKTLTSYIVDQAVPKGKARKMLRQLEKAFWLGSSGSNHCNIYHCKPAFRVYEETKSTPLANNEARKTSPKLNKIRQMIKLHKNLSYENQEPKGDGKVETENFHQSENYNSGDPTYNGNNSPGSIVYPEGSPTWAGNYYDTFSTPVIKS
jgi:hypothetical protein